MSDKISEEHRQALRACQFDVDRWEKAADLAKARVQLAETQAQLAKIVHAQAISTVAERQATLKAMEATVREANGMGKHDTVSLDDGLIRRVPEIKKAVPE